MKIFQLNKKMVITVIAIMIVILIIAVSTANKKKEVGDVYVNEKGEKVEKVIRDANISTKLTDTTPSTIETGRYFTYAITNVSGKPIKYKFQNDTYVDYILYEKNEKGKYEKIYQLTEENPKGQGVAYLKIGVNKIENRNFKLSKIAPGDYKIKFWINLEPGKEINKEEAVFKITKSYR